MDAKPLKLRATSVEEVSVVAACLQDALLPIVDIAYQPQTGRFMFVANRFRWEAGEAEPRERVLCGVVVERVRSAKLKRVDRSDRTTLLSLLTLVHTADDAGGSLTLVCSADRAIRLDIDAIDLTIEDHGRPWPAMATPRHPDESHGD
jgi:hypothetical protein